MRREKLTGWNRSVSNVVKALKPSKIREMTLLASSMEGVISLAIGEPDFHTPTDVCEKALQDAMDGATHYAPSRGDPELLEELKGYLQRRYGLPLAKSNLLITAGGMGGLTAIFRTVLNSGDEVLVPEPHFPEYMAHVELAGGRLIRVPTEVEEGYALRPEEVRKRITSKTKVLLLNSPNNPTGAVLEGEVLDELARIALEADLLVVSDEVYDRLVFDGRRHESIITRPGMFQRTVVIGSFSKAFAMTGWRLGYAFGPPDVMEEMTKVVTYYTSCASSVSQRAALAALRRSQKFADEMRDEFQRRRDLVYRALMEIPEVKVNRPAGAFYIFPSLEALVEDGHEFAIKLLEKERVAVVPGEPFGPSCKRCVRIAFTVKRELLSEAMERIRRFVKANY